MAQTVGELIRGQQILTADATMLVSNAVKLMVQHDFSQLPVVDERGRVIGLLTERGLAKAIMMGMGCDVTQMAVAQWMEEPVKVVGPTWGIYQVAKLLADTYAVVVGHNGKPIGMVTDYDIAAYLTEWSEGIALVEDIETRLRGYIERIYTSSQALDAALMHGFRASPEDPAKPRKLYSELTLREHVQFITTKENWPDFEPYFGPKDSFNKVMAQAIPIRNDIAHFRGQLTLVELGILQSARGFLARCPKVK